MLSPQTINILRLSIGVMIQFTAILSHEFIMEPLLHGFAHLGIGGIQDKDGYLSLCIIYLFNTLSCLISTWLVTKVTGKWAMVIGMVTVLCFQLSYLFPHRFGILLISMVVGVGTTFFWVGHGQYVSENVTNKNREQITSLQWAFFKGSLIIGGLFFFFYFKNSSIEDIVKTRQVKTFLYIFMGCSIFSIINTSLVPQSEMSQAREPQEFLESTKHCWKLMKTSKILCLSVFFFYTGLIRSFWISIYPACIKFTKVISTNTTSTMTMGMIVTGVGQVFASILVSLLGPRIRKVGAFVFILLALFIHCTCFLGISLTFPNEAPLGPTDKGGPVYEASQTTAMIYSFFLGFGDAILQTQVYSYVAKHYQKDSSMVFSVFRCASGIASTTLFFAAQYFYLIIHLSVLAVFACAAGFAIVVFEIRSGSMYHQKSTISVVEVIPRFNRN
ncbi:unnamed protein product [Caenorhabditis brenneri]